MSVWFGKLIQSIPVVRGLRLSRRDCFLVCEQEPTEGKPIFVAVHGTWATRSKWARGNSDLMDSLSSRWPGSGIYQFQWSGTNGVRHRLLAAEILKEELNRLSRDYRESEIVLISHSHGGNVVAGACSELTRKVSAAVYMNTPFIQALPAYPLIASLVLMLACTLSWVQIFEWLNPVNDVHLFLNRLMDIENAFAVIAVTGCFGAIALGIFLTWSLHKVRKKLATASSADRDICKQLVAFFVGDEANAILASVYFTQLFGRRSMRALFILAVSATSVARSFPRVGIVSDKAYYVGEIVVGVCLLIYTVGYGLVQALIGLDSWVAVTPAPVGSTDFQTLAWNETSRTWLNHWKIYNSPAAIAMITKWLNGVMKVQPEDGNEKLDALPENNSLTPEIGTSKAAGQR